jgi:hypothetical protein
MKRPLILALACAALMGMTSSQATRIPLVKDLMVVEAWRGGPTQGDYESSTHVDSVDERSVTLTLRAKSLGLEIDTRMARTTMRDARTYRQIIVAEVDSIDTELYILDDPSFPIILQSGAVGGEGGRVIKITYPDSTVRSELEQQLASKRPAEVYDIYFDYNEATITPQSDVALRDIADIMRRHPGRKTDKRQCGDGTLLPLRPHRDASPSHVEQYRILGHCGHSIAGSQRPHARDHRGRQRCRLGRGAPGAIRGGSARWAIRAERDRRRRDWTEGRAIPAACRPLFDEDCLMTSSRCGRSSEPDFQLLMK